MTEIESARYFDDRRVASFADALQRGDINSLKAGLVSGIDPNSPGKDGFRPIFFALFAGNADPLKLLLKAGADPNAHLSNGDPPLRYSVRKEDLEFTRALLGAGADPNGRGNNSKPSIHEAVNQPNPEQIALLVSAGANINVIWGGATPVMSALEVGQWKAALILIDSGADLTLKNDFGETALDLACQTIRALPLKSANKDGVGLVLDALHRRRVTLPCLADLEKFHKM